MVNVHMDVNTVHGKPTVKDCLSTFWKWHNYELYERPIYKRTVPSESFIEKLVY